MFTMMMPETLIVGFGMMNTMFVSSTVVLKEVISESKMSGEIPS